MLPSMANPVIATKPIIATAIMTKACPRSEDWDGFI
jgi:hypothetical protein